MDMIKKALALGLIGAALAACGGQPPSDTSVGVATSDLIQIVKYHSDGNGDGFPLTTQAVKPSTPYASGVSDNGNPTGGTEGEDLYIFDLNNHNPVQVGDTVVFGVQGFPSNTGRLACSLTATVQSANQQNFSNTFPPEFGIGGQNCITQYAQSVGSSSTVCTDERGVTQQADFTFIAGNCQSFGVNASMDWRVDTHENPSSTVRHFAYNANKF
jgi:hypothetical protein